MAEKLSRLHVHSVQDVLFHLPHRYEDRTSVTDIGSLLPSLSTVVIGQIELAQVVFGRRRSLIVSISDGTGSLTIRLFYFSRSQEKGFKRGAWVRCFGEVRRGMKGFEMVHPEYRVSSEEPKGGLDTTLTPVYPTTEGVSQSLWRKITDQVLQSALPNVQDLISADCLPDSLQAAYTEGSLQQALTALHRPDVGSDLITMQQATSSAHQRLIIEELIAHHFSLRKSRDLRKAELAPVLKYNDKLQKQFLGLLGFNLTGAQQRVNNEITEDLNSNVPTMRLIQGDVGSGKTVVAASAMLVAVNAGLQSVLMAPTELLAEQHFQTLTKWFESLSIQVGWLASKTPAKQKRDTLAKLASGELLVAVGTHALIQEAVEYQQLGLYLHY